MTATIKGLHAETLARLEARVAELQAGLARATDPGEREAWKRELRRVQDLATRYRQTSPGDSRMR